ncbi:hypothetical protein DFJ73DRAFT_781196 [Zopfochytrium polystomum]|nr:hypothetical protein DFJ73DRAFT_781196 [Zopfochytrium polystomum]
MPSPSLASGTVAIASPGSGASNSLQGSHFPMPPLATFGHPSPLHRFVNRCEPSTTPQPHVDPTLQPTPTTISSPPAATPISTPPTTTTTSPTSTPSSPPNPSTAAPPPQPLPRRFPKCPHYRRRTQCVDCYELGQGGGSLCVHRRRKDVCKACREVGVALVAGAKKDEDDGRAKRKRIRGPRSFVARPPPPPGGVLPRRRRRRFVVLVQEGEGEGVARAGGGAGTMRVPSSAASPSSLRAPSESSASRGGSNPFSIEALLGTRRDWSCEEDDEEEDEPRNKPALKLAVTHLAVAADMNRCIGVAEKFTDEVTNCTTGAPTDIQKSLCNMPTLADDY